jgi:amidase
MTSDPFDLDAVGLAEAIRRGELSPVEAVEAAARRIEAINPVVNAVIHERFERARDEAEDGLSQGPFRGVPLLLKDLGCPSAGDPRHDGMRFLRDLGWVERADSELTSRFRAAGFAILGRTNTPELGLLPTTEPEAHGPTRNPWNLERSAGGSSGGAGAAVAARMVPVAHASDSGGSIRIPASECGLVGLKPSRGRTPRGDPADSPLGGHHVVTRSVRDCVAVLDVLSGGTFASASTVPLEGLRVGFTTAAPGAMVPTHPACAAAAEALASRLGTMGHHMTGGGPPALNDLDAASAFLFGLGVAFGTEAADRLARWSVATGRPIGPEDVEVHTWALAEMGRSLSDETIGHALADLESFSAAVIGWWDEHDLLVTPTIAEPPPLLGEFVSTPEDPLAAGLRAGRLTPFTTPFNVTGQPAISLPAAWTDDGLPIGVQLVAAPCREDVLIRVAAALEDELRWGERRPPVR